MTIIHAPIEPMPHLSRWEENLRRIAASPLERCPEFPRIAERWEAWWHHELVDRPVFLGKVNTDPRRAMEKRTDLLHRQDEWFAGKQEDLEQKHFVGDCVPNIRVDFGPVLLGGLLGGRMEFGTSTSWTHPHIRDDWSNRPGGRIIDGELYGLLKELFLRVAQDAAGRYLICTPDLGGSADVLSNLRGPETLCMDVIDCPRNIAETIDAIYPAWHEALSALYDIATEAGAGLIHWLEIWSNKPYMIPACDFNFLIDQESFNRLCLPDIARQTATIGRGVFHLDGPGATRHIDALLEVPCLEAIQFVPGAGTPSTLPWVEMFRKIQGAGRSLFIVCPPDEVLRLCRSLRPEGLAIQVNSGGGPAELSELFNAFCRQSMRPRAGGG
ncbi:MAG: hypothetical protein IT442_02790 [Phycisphaeraceae bacterium]|nr:hypothetical protein [Phycisphaeraceae bacterium]